MALQRCELGADVDYQHCWQHMQAYTNSRDASSADQLWLLQHPPVYTQGQAGKAEHILNPAGIPVIAVDRGGQVTYHGPGQLVVYCLIDLARRRLGIRDLVTLLEQSLVELLGGYNIEAWPKADAPGVYVRDALGEAKIASLGLRVRQQCSYHGIALNVDMDLQPFLGINPCGYAGMRMTDMRSYLGATEVLAFDQVQQQLATIITQRLEAT